MKSYNQQEIISIFSNMPNSVIHLHIVSNTDEFLEFNYVCSVEDALFIINLFNPSYHYFFNTFYK